MIPVNRVGRLLFLAGVLGAFSPVGMAQKAPETRDQLTAIPKAGLDAIAANLREKQNRTLEEKKLDSRLLHGMRAVVARQAGQANPLPPYVDEFLSANVRADNAVNVTIRATVADDLLAALEIAGGQELASFPQFDSVTVRLPITSLLAVARRTEVRFIGITEKPTTNRRIATPEEIQERLHRFPHLLEKIGSVTSEGVVAHQANQAISTGIDGTGVYVCVISDGTDSLAARQAAGDLPPTVNVLPGQAGPGDEGTAMLEIVHDMAPGATLGFATGFPSEPQMAANIIGLRNGGCDIIVDDLTFFAEGAFQDGPVAQAANTVTASGALYVSSAGNSGNLTHASSGIWEGDFLDSGTSNAVIDDFEGKPVKLHWFGTAPYNVLTYKTGGVTLKWSDPLGAATNDYDLFVMNSSRTMILNQSVTSQTGAQDPYEGINCSPMTCPVGATLVVAQYAGTTRALRLDTHRGKLAVGSTGSTFGHNAAASAITVAAVDVAKAEITGFSGGPTIPVEVYSSDGPRKMFYNPDGTAMTPGNVLFATGGA
ncbi:MAG: hypothetical protein ABI831_16230 [Betaproteobacteria bacterium]